MKKTYKVKLKTKSEKIQTLLKRSSGAYRKMYNIATEFQLNAALLGGSLKKFYSGHEVLEYLNKSKNLSLDFLKDLDKGIYIAAVYASSKAFFHKFDFHIENVPFLSRKRTKPKFKTYGNVKVTQDSIILPKIGKISLWERGRIPLGKRYSNVTVSFDGNDWFISMDVEEPLPKVNLTETIISLDFTNDGDFILNNKVISSPAKLSTYTKEELKLKKAIKKLKRQTKANTKIGANGCRIPVTTKNMQKTQKFVDKKRVRLYNMKKDYFFKVVNGVAITKPKELHILSNSSIRAYRNGYLSRAQRRGGTADFLRMMIKKLENMGTRVLKDVGIHELPALSPRL